jgi:7-cyano-7-deazaguanine synthase in queuosine biosynthesis
MEEFMDRSSVSRVQVLAAGQKKRRGAEHCRLDREVRLDHNRIQESFPKPLSEIELDLLTLIGAVGFADRRFRRRLSQGWARGLNVWVPVSDVAFWEQPSLSTALHDCLKLVTGDQWNIKFTYLPNRRQLQTTLAADPTPFADVACVVPFSGGLDSMAGLQLWQAANPDRAALRIGTETDRGTGHIIRRTAEGVEFSKRVSVQLWMKVGNHAELSYRSRTFVYFTTAALAAKLAGVPRVLVMENGQGALGPSLIPVGSELPHRTTHPAFTTALYNFLRYVWGDQAPAFEHPNLWQTKAEMLIGAAAGAKDWSRSRSCARNPRRSKGRHLPASCGLCGGCLLRRSALVAAGFANIESQEKFVWQDLQTRSFEASSQSQQSFKVSNRDRGIAFTSILNMKFLAELAGQEPGPSVLRVAAEVARAQMLDSRESLRRVQHLIEKHAADWLKYLDYLGKDSWVTQLGQPHR